MASTGGSRIAEGRYLRPLRSYRRQHQHGPDALGYHRPAGTPHRRRSDPDRTERKLLPFRRGLADTSRHHSVRNPLRYQQTRPRRYLRNLLLFHFAPFRLCYTLGDIAGKLTLWIGDETPNRISQYLVQRRVRSQERRGVIRSSHHNASLGEAIFFIDTVCPQTAFQPEEGILCSIGIIVRAVLLLVLTIASYFMRPFGLHSGAAALAGVASGIAILSVRAAASRHQSETFDRRGYRLDSRHRRRVSDRLVLGAAVTIPGKTARSFRLLILLLMAYVGLVVGASKGDLLNLVGLRRRLRRRTAGASIAQNPRHQRHHRRPHRRHRRNRIPRRHAGDPAVRAPRIAAGGRLRRSLKRNRGRRGLDMLQRMQKMPTLDVQIRGRRFSAGPRSGYEADRTGQGSTRPRSSPTIST